MTYNQLIHDYLDTGLKQPQEDALFQALASDQTLRGDFHQQLSIMKIATNDMTNISPPMESTNAIFSSLGFSIPMGDSGAAVINESKRKPGAAIFASASGVGILNIFKDNFSTLASIAVAAVISTVLFMTFNKDMTNKEPERSGITLAQNYYDDATHAVLPIVSSIEKETKTTERSTPRNKNITPVRSNNFPVLAVTNTTEESQVVNAQVTENNDIAVNKKDYSNINKINENSYAIVKVNRLNTSSSDSPLLNMPKFNYEEKSGFALELRGANNPEQTELLNDIQLGVNFEFIDDVHAVGLIGNEHYVVRISNPIAAGEQVQYANESMVSFMFGLRYAPDELILDGLVVPYVQLMGGGLSNGFAGGFESGLMLNVNGNYSILVGYGKQYAKYNFEGNLYNASKKGINVGLRYTF